jgi:hypothetical protein
MVSVLVAIISGLPDSVPSCSCRSCENPTCRRVYPQYRMCGPRVTSRIPDRRELPTTAQLGVGVHNRLECVVHVESGAFHCTFGT